jgi:DNA-binding MarR family transcriptional regulator
VAVALRLAVARTARRLRQEAGTELSPSLASALVTLERHGPLTPSELAARERVQRPTMTRVAARLAQAGLVARAADPVDGRSALLSISEDGRRLLARSRTRKNAFLARRLRELDAADRVMLDRAATILERLLEAEPA